MNELKSSMEYQEGVDYVVSYEAEELSSGGVGYKMYFKNPQGNILAYFVFNISQWYSLPPSANIQTTSTASGFNYFPEDKIALYQAHGYSPDAVLKDFWKTAFAYMLRFIKEKHPKVDMALVAAFKENENAVWALLNRVQQTAADIVRKIGGGNEVHMATVFLR